MQDDTAKVGLRAARAFDEGEEFLPVLSRGCLAGEGAEEGGEMGGAGFVFQNALRDAAVTMAVQAAWGMKAGLRSALGR